MVGDKEPKKKIPHIDSINHKKRSKSIRVSKLLTEEEILPDIKLF